MSDDIVVPCPACGTPQWNTHLKPPDSAAVGALRELVGAHDDKPPYFTDDDDIWRQWQIANGERLSKALDAARAALLPAGAKEGES